MNKSYKKPAPERFYDCLSDNEAENNCASGGDAGNVVSNLADPVQTRAVLERALHATQNLLGFYGRSVAPVGRSPSPAELNYYPATLEVTVTLKTEEKSICPKDRQYRLRGDPVKLNLPIELNPESGKVKMNVFRPRPGGVTCGGARQCGAGAPDAAGGDRCKVKKRKSSSPVRRVRWLQQEQTEESTKRQKFEGSKKKMY